MVGGRERAQIRQHKQMQGKVWSLNEGKTRGPFSGLDERANSTSNGGGGGGGGWGGVCARIWTGIPPISFHRGTEMAEGHLERRLETSHFISF